MGRKVTAGMFTKTEAAVLHRMPSMKNLLKYVLVIAFIFSILCLSSGFAESYMFIYEREETDSNGNTSTYHYDISFDYSDAMLLTSAETMVSKLSKASVALATAAYDQQSIVNLVRQMGFTKLNAINYSGGSVTLQDADYVGYLLSEKETVLNGQNYVIYLVPIRGTISSNAEWFSDFNLGTAADHAGFYHAAAEVQRNLEGRISANANRYDADHTIVWLMGHSRGAAVSNIVAGRLTEKARSGQIALKSTHIHSYNYACPAVSQNADVDMENVHNFINNKDLIPTMPAQDWGYRRYGQNHDINETPANDKDFAYHFEQSHSAEYTNYDKDMIYSVIISLLKSPETLDSPAVHAVVDLALLKFVAPESGITVGDIITKHFENRGFVGSLVDWVADQLASLPQGESSNETGNIIGSFVSWAGSMLDQADIDELNLLKDMYNELMEKLTPVVPGIFDAHTPETYVNWLDRDGYGYNLQDDKIEGNYVLPNYVTTICPDMFSGNKKITSVTIHGNITNPENLRFSGCTNLRTVNLEGDAVRAFPDAMFAGCSMLESVTFSDELESIGNVVFEECSSLRSISFPTTMISMGNVNFWGCDSLEYVSMPGLVEMGNTCFYNCPMLNNISLPDSLVSVGDSCFSNCTGLTSITIPASLQNWGTAMFQNCSSLKTVNFSNNLTVIGVAAFYNCDALVSIVVPDSVCEIGASAWGGCASIKKVTMPIDAISSSLFADTPVERVVFTKGRNGVMSPNAICGFSRTVRSVTFAEGVTHVGSTCLPGEGVLEEVIFPSTLQEIGQTAFVNQNHLTTITFPAGIREIGNYCFADCTALSQVFFQAGIPSAIQARLIEGNNIFYGANPTLYIPHGTPVAEEVILTKSYYCPTAPDEYMTFTCAISDEQKPTCLEEGIGAYPYCPHCGMIFADTTMMAQATVDDFVLPVDPTNHLWDEPVYVWSDDNTVLTGRHTCLRNVQHFEEESVGAVRTATQSPTADAEGIYLAVSKAFANTAFTTQEIEGAIPATGTLNTLVLPIQLSVIEDEAFEGNTMEAVNISAGCGRIGSRAFADCPNLIYAQIPETVELAEDAFAGSSHVILDWITNSAGD